MSELQKTIIKIFSWYFLFVVVCSLLLGCSKKDPVETAFNETNTAIVIAKETLPEECKTEEVLAKFETLETKSQVAESVCQAKIKDVQNKYERSLWVLFLIIFAFFAKFLIKR